ncbi:hypothetical protein [Aliiglaciecola litoralis]|uniref:Uncharacterized protein n=1 Tax=Aliiglaciecola litoralis TaxID=582857 RepID=A0ABN1LEJ6_9ALTE
MGAKDQNQQGIAHYAALKTAIANGEEQLVKDLLTKQPMQELEKNYLIELAELSNNSGILELLKGTPTFKNAE